MDPIKVGRSIALLRKKYGMTQQQLAEELHVTDKAVSRWERGLGAPDISLLVNLSITLDVDIETLLEGNIGSLAADWRGVLVLSYPVGISALDFIGTKRIIYLQLSYFLLVGITEVLLVGHDAERIMHTIDTKKYGIRLERTYEKVSSSEMIMQHCKKNALMVMEGLDFLYGKDFTKYLHRPMNGIRKHVKIETFEGTPTSIHLYPKGWDGGDEHAVFKLDRGMISFNIGTVDDLFDAGCLIKMIEAHQDESILDLGVISKNRHIKT